MVIDDALLAELSTRNKNYSVICDLFGLKEAERINPNAGTWIVDRIKNYKTGLILYESMANKAHLATPPLTPPPGLDIDNKADTVL